jgi:uncharacterized membrane protein YagU involved in acid resistance
MSSMSVANIRRPKHILRAVGLPSLPSRLLVSTWQVALPIAFLFCTWGISILLLCTYDICIDRVWMSVSLTGCYTSIALGALAYVIDLLFLDGKYRQIESIKDTLVGL